jgi:hypothetical protein
MYKLINNDIIQEDNNIVIILEKTNLILSTHKQNSKQLDIIGIENGIRWYDNDTNIELYYYNTKELIKNIQYLLLDSEKIKNLTNHKLEKIIKFDPSELLNIIFSDNLNNPVILFNKLNLNTDIIYQIFILFLNKTIKNKENPDYTSMVGIIEDFVQDNYIDLAPFVKLFLFYMRERDLTPITISYNYYSVNE